MIAFLVLVVVCVLQSCWCGSSSKAQDNVLCGGHWETLQSMEQHSYSIKAGRTPKQANNSVLGYTPWNQPWFWEACPTQTTLHSCHFHSNKTHADLLERRVWVTHDASCLEFAPLEFLQLLRDRRLIIIGDSLLTQLWQVLICALHGTAENRLYVHWAKMWRCNEVTCPNDREVHSNCYGGVSRFPTFNVTIINKKMYKYSKDYFFGTLQRLKVTSRDVILVNFGLHYNEEKEYSHAIESFNQDIQESSILTTAKLAFFETSPQHYPTSNGYFKQGDQNGNQCQAFSYDTSSAVNSYIASHDWRNEIIQRVFRSSASSSTSAAPVRVIPLAHGLYSQHDAHVAIEPYPSPPWLDCTHWCFPSGALRYFILHMYNGLRKVIGKETLTSGNKQPSAHYHSDSFAQPHIHYSKNSKAGNDLSLIQALGYPDGSLLKGSGRSIYLIKGQQKREFGSFDAFRNMGLDSSQVVKISDEELDEIPLGPIIT
jgi:hypothetical protein